MAFKIVILSAIVAMVNAGFIPSGSSYVAPVAYAQPAHLTYPATVAKAVVTDPYEHSYDHNPQYSYSYDVHDTLTGDAKSQQETRNGDVVEGSYSFIEADGSRRVVHYTADDHNGFNAVVEKQPAQVAVKTVAPVHVKTVAPVHLKTVAPVAYAAPAYVHQPAPLTYSAPVYHH